MPGTSQFEGTSPFKCPGCGRELLEYNMEHPAYNANEGPTHYCAHCGSRWLMLLLGKGVR